MQDFWYQQKEECGVIMGFLLGDLILTYSLILIHTPGLGRHDEFMSYLITRRVCRGYRIYSVGLCGVPSLPPLYYPSHGSPPLCLFIELSKAK